MASDSETLRENCTFYFTKIIRGWILRSIKITEGKEKYEDKFFTRMVILDHCLENVNVQDISFCSGSYFKKIQACAQAIKPFQFSSLIDELRNPKNITPIDYISLTLMKMVLHNICKRLLEILKLSKIRQKSIGQLNYCPESTEYYTIDYDEQYNLKINRYFNLFRGKRSIQFSIEYYSIHDKLFEVYYTEEGRNEEDLIYQCEITNKLSYDSVAPLIFLIANSQLPYTRFLRIFEKILDAFKAMKVINSGNAEFALVFIVHIAYKTMEDFKNIGSEEYDHLVSLCGQLLDTMPAKILILDRPGAIENLVDDVIYVLENLCALKRNGNNRDIKCSTTSSVKKLQMHVNVWNQAKKRSNSFTYNCFMKLSRIEISKKSFNFRTINFGNRYKANLRVDMEFSLQPTYIPLKYFFDDGYKTDSTLQDWKIKTESCEDADMAIAKNPSNNCAVCLENLSENFDEVGILSYFEFLYTCILYELPRHFVFKNETKIQDWL